MYKEIFIKMEQHEVTAVLLEDQQMMEVYFERANNQRLAGNIYKGVVENVLPGMQAAFVDIGLEKNAFLYVDDAVPRTISEDGSSHIVANCSIGEVLKRGQELLVQIVKEPVGSKGARVTTYPTLPGRYAVLMPMVNYVGISRRIESEEERKRLKELAEKLKDNNTGLIIRTIAEGVSEEELAADLRQLARQWRKIQSRAVKCKAPSLVRKEADLLSRVVRDILVDDVQRILVNTPEAVEQMRELVHDVSPSLESRVFLCESKDIFSVYDVNGQMEKALRRRVWLKCGGYIIIDQMEALTTIDVNTGKYVGKTNLSDTVLKTNLEAAAEIARQLRIRNIGGIVIIDFIDMNSAEAQKQVIDELERNLKKDRTKTNILGLTQLGLLEMTRKKVGHELTNIIMKECPYCGGRGRVLTEENAGRNVIRELMSLAESTAAPAILIEVNPDVAAWLIGPGGVGLARLERESGKTVVVRGVSGMTMEDRLLRPAYDEAEARLQSSPVAVGETLRVHIVDPHVDRDGVGIARIHGFVINVADAADYVGSEVWVRIQSVQRTSAQATLIQPVQPTQ